MKKYKIKKSDFIRIFPNRALTWHEKYFQKFQLVDDCGSYKLIQSLSFIGVVFILVSGVAMSAPVMLWSGIKGLIDMWSEIARVSLGPVRSDGCPDWKQSTSEIKKSCGIGEQ